MCFSYLPRERQKVLLASLGPLAALRTEGSTRTPVFIVAATWKERSVPPRAGGGVTAALTQPTLWCPLGRDTSCIWWDSIPALRHGGGGEQVGSLAGAGKPPSLALTSHSRGSGLSESLQRKARGEAHRGGGRTCGLGPACGPLHSCMCRTLVPGSRSADTRPASRGDIRFQLKGEEGESRNVTLETAILKYPF